MALLHNPSLLLLLCFAGLVGARELAPLRPDRSLEARLATSGLVECWKAMTELRSCTNEIVLFFLNGDSYLTQGCCRAIRLITRSCWPAMLASVGFTAEEADILRGYCDAEMAAPPAAPTPLPVPPVLAPLPPAV